MSLTSRITTRMLRSPAPSSTAHRASVSPPPGLSRRRALLSLATLPATALIAACGGQSSGATGDGPAAGAEGSDARDGQPTADDPPVAVSVAWVDAAADGMASAFGVITATADADLPRVSATTPASTAVALHQTPPDGSGGMSMEE